jgi:hypothetical protein
MVCFHPDSPAARVMSSKTTGPESTKLSAVTGVLRTPFTAAGGAGALPLPMGGPLVALCASQEVCGERQRTPTIAIPQASDLRDCTNGALLEFDLMASLNSLLYAETPGCPSWLCQGGVSLIVG